MTAKPLPVLTLVQTRVLGVLVEKERTVPDTYPLTLNSLAAGCNQKTSRDPVINASDAEIQAAIDDLKRLSLVLETSGGRVMRYSHNVKRVLEIPSESVALLASLMLRGPQTAGELRINSERLCRFSDISAVEGFLNELAQRSSGALVVELPRQAGARETRWLHLLSGPPAEAMLHPVAELHVAQPDPSAAKLIERVVRLEAELAELKSTVASLCAKLGSQAS